MLLKKCDLADCVGPKAAPRAKSFGFARRLLKSFVVPRRNYTLGPKHSDDPYTDNTRGQLDTFPGVGQMHRTPSAWLCKAAGSQL